MIVRTSHIVAKFIWAEFVADWRLVARKTFKIVGVNFAQEQFAEQNHHWPKNDIRYDLCPSRVIGVEQPLHCRPVGKEQDSVEKYKKAQIFYHVFDDDNFWPQIPSDDIKFHDSKYEQNKGCRIQNLSVMLATGKICPATHGTLLKPTAFAWFWSAGWSRTWLKFLQKVGLKLFQNYSKK